MTCEAFHSAGRQLSPTAADKSLGIFGMSRPVDELTDYFAAASALRSDVPAVRRPAIQALLELVGHSRGSVRASAERTLIEEFGPDAVSEGLPPCTAPYQVAERCDGNCKSCAWLRQDEQTPSAEDSKLRV